MEVGIERQVKSLHSLLELAVVVLHDMEMDEMPKNRIGSMERMEKRKNE